MVLHEDHRLVRRHQPPGRRREPGQVGQLLAARAGELVADAAVLELGDIGRATRPVAQAVVVLRVDRLPAEIDHLGEDVGQR